MPLAARVAMVGAASGPSGALLTIFGASVAGSILGILLIPLRGGSLRDTLPFGCFLAPCAVAGLLWGGALVDAYFRAVLAPG